MIPVDLTFQRDLLARYQDPLDVIWLGAARAMGITVVRSPEVYAATDGRGTLTLGATETLDPDDSLAQAIFHEVCHWITHGRESYHLPDWGFALDSPFDWREHACLRLQAVLTDRYGLGRLLAPTTCFRAYWDVLGADRLSPLPDWPDEDRVVALAAEALARVDEPPWGDPLRDALAATARVAALVRPWVGSEPVGDPPLGSVWR